MAASSHRYCCRCTPFRRRLPQLSQGEVMESRSRSLGARPISSRFSSRVTKHRTISAALPSYPHPPPPHRAPLYHHAATFKGYRSCHKYRTIFAALPSYQPPHRAPLMPSGCDPSAKPSFPHCKQLRNYSDGPHQGSYSIYSTSTAQPSRLRKVEGGVVRLASTRFGQTRGSAR